MIMKTNLAFFEGVKGFQYQSEEISLLHLPSEASLVTLQLMTRYHRHYRRHQYHFSYCHLPNLNKNIKAECQL